ncbi:hypothetical protein M405DRAFT_835295, partial [Rhizopogon salebrosus TDB-379]
MSSRRSLCAQPPKSNTWIIHLQTAHFDTRSLATLTYPARMTPSLRNGARFSHHGLTLQNTGPTSRQNSPCRLPADLKLIAFSSVVHIYSHSPHHPSHILISISLNQSYLCPIIVHITFEAHSSPKSIRLTSAAT